MQFTVAIWYLHYITSLHHGALEEDWTGGIKYVNNPTDGVMSIVGQAPGATGPIKRTSGEPSVVTHFRVAMQVFLRNQCIIKLLSFYI